MSPLATDGRRLSERNLEESHNAEHRRQQQQPAPTACSNFNLETMRAIVSPESAQADHPPGSRQRHLFEDFAAKMAAVGEKGT